MTVSSSAAAAAAAAAARAEAARRAAELAAKKAAEAAAKKAAEAAAKKAANAAAKKAADKAAEAAAKKVAEAAQKKNAAQLSQQAGQRPMASSVRQAFGKDEVSRGLGMALRQRSATALGGPAPSAPTAPGGRTASLSELRAIQARGGSISQFRSPDSIDRAAQAKAPTTPPTPEERAAQGARDVEKAYTDATAAGHNEAYAANAASQKLRELTQASDDPAYKNALIRSSQPTIDNIAEVIGKNAADDAFTGDEDKQLVKDSIRALADVATASGEIGSFMIGEQIAAAIPDESELMHVDDAFYEHSDAGGENHLMAAVSARLQAQGKNDANDELIDRHEGGLLGDVWDATGGKIVGAAGDIIGAVGDGLGAVVGFAGDAANGVLNVIGEAGEMAVDVAKGTVELAGNAAEFTADQVTAAAEYAAKNGLKLAGEALNWVGDHARELAADALDIDGQLAQLNSPGDSVTIAVGGSIGATVLQGGAEVEMKVTKTEDGYEMSLTGQISGGVFGGLSLPGFPSAEGEANATGIANATMKFDSLDEVTQAAETVGGIGIAAAVGGPAGALLTGATAGDEIRAITDHFQSGSVGLELSAEASASLGETAGIGAGAEINGKVTTGARLEITKGQPPAIVLEQSIEASGSLALGLPVDIPSLGGKLNGGSIDGSATVTAETRIPLPAGMDLGDVVRDPVGAVKDVAQNVIDNTTTKLSIGVDVSAGAATEGLPIDFGANGGLEIELSGEAKTKDLAGALAQAMSGDLSGALNTLGTKTELSVDVNSYTQSDLINIDEEISVPGFTIGIKAQDSIRDETDVWSFEGTPAELANQGFNLFKSLDLNVS